jgi:hypothetical protein
MAAPGPLMGEFIPDDADFGRPTYAPVTAVDHDDHNDHNDHDDTPPLPSRNSSISHFRPRSTTSTKGSSSLRARLGLLGVARRTLGILLLLFTVFMWTLSNFLASVSFPPFPLLGFVLC